MLPSCKLPGELSAERCRSWADALTLGFCSVHCKHVLQEQNDWDGAAAALYEDADDLHVYDMTGIHDLISRRGVSSCDI